MKYWNRFFHATTAAVIVALVAVLSSTGAESYEYSVPDFGGPIFLRPTGEIAAASDGRLWLAEDYYFSVFDPDIEQPAETVLFSETPDFSDDVRGLARDPLDDSVLYALIVNHPLARIVIFDTVTLQRVGGWDVSSLSAPRGLAIDPISGDIFVPESGGSRVVRYDRTGNQVGSLDGSLGGAGAFDSPQDVAFDAAGNVYVADYEARRVQKFDAELNYVAHWDALPPESDVVESFFPAYITVDSQQNVIVSENNGLDRFLRFDGDGNLLALQRYQQGITSESLFHLNAIAVSGERLFAADSAGVVELDQAGLVIDRFGLKRADPGFFVAPSGITISPTTGDVFVTDIDFRSLGVQRFNGSGTWLASWRVPQVVDDATPVPCGIAAASNGDLLITDCFNDRILRVSADGLLIASYGRRGAGNGEFAGPNGIAVDRTGNIYVADTLNNRVQKLGPDGAFLQTFGVGQLNGPTAVAVDAAGNVYATDPPSNHVKKFRSDGALLLSWYASAFEGFGGVYGVGVDDDCNVYVSEAVGYVQAFSSTGVRQGQLTAPRLGTAGHSAIDPSGHILVVSRIGYFLSFLADAASTVDTDGDGIRNGCDPDDDNDTFGDEIEATHASDPLAASSTPEGPTADAAIGGGRNSCDGADNDADGQTDEFFPNFDGDSQADCVDLDDDNDAVPDVKEVEFGSNPLDPASKPEGPAADAEFGSNSCDGLDNDSDGLTDESFPNFDGDLLANCIDPDDDNDAVPDLKEVEFGSDSLNASSKPEGVAADAEFGSNSCDGADNDADGLTDETFPNYDGDSQADCVDPDDDNDVVPDLKELEFGSNPLDPASKPEGVVADAEFGSNSCDGADNDADGLTDETFPNFDGDSLADCVDPDDDNDAVPDLKEAQYGSDPLNAASRPEGPVADADLGTNTCDDLDNDLDSETDEMFPDFDADTRVNCVDPDDDNDLVPDVKEVEFGSNPLNAASKPEGVAADTEFGSSSCDGLDNDGDGLTDETFPNFDADPLADCVDPDDDNDTFTDTREDEFGSQPRHPNSTPEGAAADAAIGGGRNSCDGADNDLDSITDETFPNYDADALADCVDPDDDNDAVTDVKEVLHGSNPLNAASKPEGPGADGDLGTNSCDGIDNDLDGQTDEAFLDFDNDDLADCIDPDDDNDGASDLKEILFVSDRLNAASKPEGAAADADLGTNTCDGVDNDLDGTRDETFPNFDGDTLADCVDPDDDNDTFTDTREDDLGSQPRHPGSTPEGSAADAAIGGARNSCDNIDNDLDGLTDETFPNYDGDSQADCVDLDDDNDGVGDVAEALTVSPGNLVPSNPRDALSTPELCDGVDNDRNEGTDEGFPNTDLDSEANCIDPDDDNDAVLDSADNCQLVANADQADNDTGGGGDACDPDDDDDGVLDTGDNCPLEWNPDQRDSDVDGAGDVCDSSAGDFPDSDGDGIANDIDYFFDGASAAGTPGNQTFSDVPLGGRTSGGYVGAGRPRIKDATPNPGQGVAVNVTTAAEVTVELTGKESLIRLRRPGTYILTDPNRTVTVEASDGGEAEVTLVIGGTPVVFVIGNGGSLTYTEVTGVGGELIGVTLDAQRGNVTISAGGQTAAASCGGMPIDKVIFGTSGNDTLTGTGLRELIFGLGGNDTISAGAGNDCIVGGEGSDSLSGGSGNDRLLGEGGNDTLNGDSGTDAAIGGANTDACNAESETACES